MARIAFIEHRDDVAALGRSVLTARGHAVESYRDLAEALAHLRGTPPPDAVIAGASAPPAPTATEAMRFVRELGPEVPALLLVSGGGDERALVEGLDAGFDDVIMVPFKPADLVGRVTALLRGRRSTSSRVQRSSRAGTGPPASPVGGSGRQRPSRAAGARPDADAGQPSATAEPAAPRRGPEPLISPAAVISAAAIKGDEAFVSGAIFEEYTLVRTLGIGGMGVVFEAFHSQTGEACALKILREDVAQEKDAELRFLREAYVLVGIRDPNIVQILNIGQSGGRLFYSMELIHGENLAQKLDREQKIAPKEACRIGSGISRALAALDRGGIVHRDVKPGNVFLGSDGLVKLGDFGLAKRAFARDVTPVREPFGTPHYLAPEVIAGGEATPQSDVYSLGVVLHEMMSGKPPYDGEGTLALLYRICHGQQADLATSLEHIPDMLRAVVAKALNRDPKNRYPNAASLGRSLESIEAKL